MRNLLEGSPPVLLLVAVLKMFNSTVRTLGESPDAAFRRAGCSRHLRRSHRQMHERRMGGDEEGNG
jgi:hypothetical protein